MEDEPTKWELRLFPRVFMDRMSIIVHRNGEVVGSFHIQGDEELAQWRGFAEEAGIQFHTEQVPDKTN